MDAVVAITRLIIADAGRVRCHIVSQAAHRAFARELGRRHPELRQFLRSREDEERVTGAVAATETEQAEGIAGDDPHGSQGKGASTGARYTGIPLAPTVSGQAHDGPGWLARHVRGVLHLQPQFGVEGPVGELHADVGALTHLHAPAGAFDADVDPTQVGKGPEEADGDEATDEVGRAVEQPVAAHHREAQECAEYRQDDQQVLVAPEYPAQAGHRAPHVAAPY